ncbi:MAG: ABC transporter permease [Candidatus Tenebribacter burtonii]|nr:ABC transporter permease [Candidatus Tenebribacter burtonii]
MLLNYFKMAFRNIRRNKAHATINILGLAVGLAACILITLWIMNELSYDKFNYNLDIIYNVPSKTLYGSSESWSTGTPPMVAPTLKEQYPEVTNSARHMNGAVDLSLAYGDKVFKESIQMADPEIFEIFTFPFILGSYEKAKTNNFTIALSETMAKKYFGQENPVGKSLNMDNKGEMEVIGVFADIPQRSTFRFDFFVPLDLVNLIWQEGYTKTWYNCSFITYITLLPGTSAKELQGKISNLIKDNNPESTTKPLLYKLSRLHLYFFGNIKKVKTVGIIAGLILLIACINFVNLTTARSAKRAREVGMRKVVGARKLQLIRQFLFESIFFAMISIFLAVALVEIFLPFFNNISGRELVFVNAVHIRLLLTLPLFGILIGFLAGIYPAFVLSAFKPISVLKSSKVSLGGRSLLRKVLVILQFTLSIILIISTFVIVKQTKFLQDKDLGYDREHLLYVPLQGKLLENPELLRSELLKNPDIENVAFLAKNPVSIWSNGSGWSWEGKPDDLDPYVTYQGVDPEYLNTFKLEMAQGEFYTDNTSGANNIVVNESFVAKMGVENPVGMQLKHEDKSYNILGIVKNFHYKSTHRNIGPIVIFRYEKKNMDWLSFRFAYMRVKGENIHETLTFIEATTRSFTSGFPYEFHFLQDDLDSLYISDRQTARILTSFAILAIFISCLGLLGLSTFLTEQRTKEIGIRKVLGSSVSQIIHLLTIDFTKWVIISNLIAWPIAYYLLQKWMNSFPYKIGLNVWYFIMAGFLTLLIALTTISAQAIKAANSNPVKALKYE